MENQIEDAQVIENNEQENKKEEVQVNIGDVFLAAYDDRQSMPAELTEYKLLAMSKFGLKVEKVNSENQYDDKIKWYNKDYFQRNYVILEIIEKAEA